MSFLASCQNLVSRPWVIDDLDAFKVKWSKKSWKKVMRSLCSSMLSSPCFDDFDFCSVTQVIKN